MQLIQTLKSNSKLIGSFFVVVLIAAALGYLAGKNSLPAKIETKVAEKDSTKEVSKELQVASIKRTTSTITAKDGSKKEVTFDEMNFSSEKDTKAEAKHQLDSQQVVKNNMFGLFYVPNYNIDDHQLNHAVVIEYGNFMLFGNAAATWQVKNVGIGYGIRF